MKGYENFKGKKFTFNPLYNEYFQSDYSNFELLEEGELQVPKWNNNDERWETTGIVCLKDSAKIMTEDEYNKLTSHYEDDWWNWEDLFILFEERD